MSFSDEQDEICSRCFNEEKDCDKCKFTSQADYYNKYRTNHIFYQVNIESFINILFFFSFLATTQHIIQIIIQIITLDTILQHKGIYKIKLEHLILITIHEFVRE